MSSVLRKQLTADAPILFILYPARNWQRG